MILYTILFLLQLFSIISHFTIDGKEKPGHIFNSFWKYP